MGNSEDISLKAMLAIDGVGFDWSDMAEEQVQTNMALIVILDSEVIVVKSRAFLGDDCVREEGETVGIELSRAKESYWIVRCERSRGVEGWLLSHDITILEDTSSFVESPLNVDKRNWFFCGKKKGLQTTNHEKPVKKSVSDAHGTFWKHSYLLDFKEFDGGYVTFGEEHMVVEFLKEEISQDCIVMTIWKDAPYFDLPSKDVGHGDPKSATDDQNQVKDGPDNENDEKDKSEDDSSPKKVNTARQHVNTASP
ncbi:hypothetical protein Tco_0175448 [Tanacetum coccineum]